MYPLNDKTVFLTGGTAGIGLAVAGAFVKAGAEVVIAGRRDAGEGTARDIGARFYRLDVSNGDAVREKASVLRIVGNDQACRR